MQRSWEASLGPMGTRLQFSDPVASCLINKGQFRETDSCIAGSGHSRATKLCIMHVMFNNLSAPRTHGRRSEIRVTSWMILALDE